jgi:hypothetical protein
MPTLNRHTIWALAALFAFSLNATTSHSAPSITSVDVSQLSQGIITISGSGFGSGPQIEVYDDFEHSNAQAGEPIVGNQAIVGDWVPHSSRIPRYDNMALSGNYSANLWSATAYNAATLTHYFKQPVQSVYMSYWIKIPTGYPFPGLDSSHQGFSSDSSWKFSWLIDQDYKGNSSDMYGPAYAGRGSMLIGGNDGKITSIANIENYWSWGKWMRYSTWVHADPNAPTTNGRVKVQVWSQEKGFYDFDVNRAVFDADGPTVKQYQYFNIPGWIRSFQNNNGRPLYDDIYVASGLNAFARVELTDSTNYQGSTKFAIQEITSWNSNQITFKVVNSNITDLNNAAIHVFAGDASSTTSGTIINGGTPATSNPPLPPSILNIKSSS